MLLSRFCKGYLARRACLKERLRQKTDALYSYYWRIDQIQRGHFQRMVRRAWLAYKARKEEKKRKKREAAAKKKKRFGGYAPASRPSGTAASSSKSASPVKGLGDSMKAALKRKVTAKNDEIKRSRESSKPTSPRDAAGDKPAADVQQIGASLNLQKVEPSPPVS
jgi:hypothetical protein